MREVPSEDAETSTTLLFGATSNGTQYLPGCAYRSVRGLLLTLQLLNYT